MYQMIGAIDLLLGVMCGVLATLMIISNPSGGVFLNAMAFVVALSGVGLSSVGLYLVSKQTQNESEYKMTSRIYKVKDVSEEYGGSPAYAVVHVYEGIVSVWDSPTFADAIAEDLELGYEV